MQPLPAAHTFHSALVEPLRRPILPLAANVTDALETDALDAARLLDGTSSPTGALCRGGSVQSTDVVLPTAEHPHRELRIRCVVRPDQAQAALLDRLGLRLPERLTIPIGPDKV